MRKILAEEVKAYREKYGVSMFDAKAAVERKAALEAIEEATSVDDLKEVLRYVLNHLYPG